MHVYIVMSDYQVGHFTILPKPLFSKIVVLEGGKRVGIQGYLERLFNPLILGHICKPALENIWINTRSAN